MLNYDYRVGLFFNPSYTQTRLEYKQSFDDNVTFAHSTKYPKHHLQENQQQRKPSCYRDRFRF